MIIRNSPWKNIYGDGHQKEMIDEKTGKRYVVRNTPWKNFYGDDGYQQEIVEVGGGDMGPLTAEDEHSYSLFMGYGGAALMGFAILFISTEHLFEWSWWLAVGITALILIVTILKDIAAFINGLCRLGILAGFIGSFLAFMIYCTTY